VKIGVLIKHSLHSQENNKKEQKKEGKTLSISVWTNEKKVMVPSRESTRCGIDPDHNSGDQAHALK
jgi:hypothetical protein